MCIRDRHKRHVPTKTRTGIYKLICDDCDCYYVGQTGRPFIKRFKEHTPHKSISKNIGSLDNIKSNYARHLIDNNHSYKCFDTNFIPLHFCDKGLRMNALEEFEIYRGHNLSLIHI